MESPSVIRHNIHFRYRAPSNGCFQGDAERQFVEVISSSFDTNQVSILLRLFSVMILMPSWVLIPSSCSSYVRNLMHGFPLFWFSCLITRSQSGAFVSMRVSCQLSTASWFLGGLSLHLNHLIESRVTNYDWPFGTLPFGLFGSNLDTRDLETYPRTYSGHF